MVPRRAVAAAAIWAVVTVLIIGGAAGVTWWLLRGGDTGGAGAGAGASGEPATRPTLAAGRDYYLVVRLVEFTPKMPSGKSWDTDGSAPDAKVHIDWRGNRIFSLPTREDTLIAAWDVFSVRISPEDLVKGKPIDIAGAINGPIVTARPDELVTIDIHDADLVSYDLAARINVRLTDLREGANDVPVPPGCGVKRLRVDMLRRDMPLDEMIRYQVSGK